MQFIMVGGWLGEKNGKNRFCRLPTKVNAALQN
jgi:hypothetical protein